MHRDLDALMDWGSTWGIKFNAKKCNIMRVSRSRKPLQHFYSLGNEILQEVSDAKYLGIQIDNLILIDTRAYLRGGSGGSNPPPKFSDFFLKSEGKEIERKRKKGMLGGGGPGYLLTYFWG